MLLGPTSLIDCFVFCVFLAIQLLWRVGLFGTLVVIVQTLPFLVWQLPVRLLRDRFCSSPNLTVNRPPSLFQQVVIHCVRHSFPHLPTHVAKVFFIKEAALPFFQWRLLRHGYIKCPVYWRQVAIKKNGTSVKGIWIRQDPEQTPDVVIYYVNGGGFALGSCHFYLEILLTWHQLLVKAGYKNPAIFALEYTLVPEARYPTQISETMLGWEHVVQMVNGDGSRICVAGDSAGGTLILSLLLQLGDQAGGLSSAAISADHGTRPSKGSTVMPQLAILVSPWVTLTTKLHYPSRLDYLNRETLWQYAHAYAGGAMVNQPPASPGCCLDGKLWKAASPSRGYVVFVGQEEVLAPDIENFMELQTRNKVEVSAMRMERGVHAWPIAAMYLETSQDLRLHWLRVMTNQISLQIPAEASENMDQTRAFRLDQVKIHGQP